jgi:UDP-glucose:tetrahydrobiopterin glucosyltransferase
VEGLRVLIASTPVGPVGSGLGGGVELTLTTLTAGLSERGHRVEVVAPAGSLVPGVVVHEAAGVLQPGSQLSERDAPVEIVPGSVLTAMWDRVADLADDVDVIVNLAYDWLPMYLTGWARTPVVHLVSMGSLTEAMDAAIRHVAARHPDRLAVHSRAQAATFDRADAGAIPFRVLGAGISVERYRFRAEPDREHRHLGAVGRISPEKGLEDVAALSATTGWPVRVWGLMQEPDYWARLCADHPDADLEYAGFLSTDELQEAIGGCTALVMTPRWLEAFGLVAVEAMATGVPVVTYDQGGPAEIVVDGRTGFVVPPDRVDLLARALEDIDTIDRAACRARVEAEYSTSAFAARVEAWLLDVVEATRSGVG